MRGLPFKFEFRVSSDTFRNPHRMGRPPGVFKADCWGRTPSGISHPSKKAIDRGEFGHARFPLATAFSSLHDAALECDFWKLVLRRKFFLEIPWSHGSLDAFIEASRAANEETDPTVRVYDESKWTLELQDFICDHQALLLQHRDAHKPEVDLDEWERVARKDGVRALLVWVQQMRDIARELESIPELDVKRAQSIITGLTSLRKFSDFSSPQFSPANKFLSELRMGAMLCEHLVDKVESRRRDLKSAWSSLLANRPPAISDTEPGTPLYYQSDVT